MVGKFFEKKEDAAALRRILPVKFCSWRSRYSTTGHLMFSNQVIEPFDDTAS